MSDIAIIIPAYNEARTIRDIAQRSLLQNSLVIVVDDGSQDDTAIRLDALPVKLLRHESNQGKAASLWHGFQMALENNAHFIVTLDADGQHRPEDIPRLTALAKENPRCIIVGSRLANKAAIPASRYYANKVANFWIAWAAGTPIEDSQSGFRVYPAALLQQLTIGIDKENSFVFESEILIRAAHAGFHSIATPIEAIYNEDARPSHFRGVRDISLITRMVAGQLFHRGFYPSGFYRAFFKSKLPFSRYKNLGFDGYAMLSLSMLLIILTAGLGLFTLSAYIFYIGRAATACNDRCAQYWVLGMQLKQRNVTSPYAKRLQRAHQALQHCDKSGLLILGGVTDESTLSESQAGKDYLVKLGCDPARIEIEEFSHNTLENLKQAKTLLAKGALPVTLISQRYHLARSSIFASGFAIKHQLCAADDTLSFSFGNMVVVLKEAFHLHWYYCGYYWSRWTRNKTIQSRIS